MTAWLAAALVAVLALGIGLFALSRAAHDVALKASGYGSVQTSAHCIPSDFPTYPGQSVRSIVLAQESSASVCIMELELRTDSVAATAFYADHLDSGGWAVTKHQRDGYVAFERRNDPSVHGEVLLLSLGKRTMVDVKVTNDH